MATGKGQTYTSEGGNGYKNPYSGNSNYGNNYGTNYNPRSAYTLPTANTSNWTADQAQRQKQTAGGTAPAINTKSSSGTGIGDRIVNNPGEKIPEGYATRVVGKLRGSDDDSGNPGTKAVASDSGSGGGGGGSVSSYTPNDSYLQKYLDLLNQAYQGYRNAQDELLKQRLAQADFDAMESRERNNMNAKLAERRVNNIYGSMNNGARNASASRVWANWLNGGSNIERDRLNSRQTHQINYTNALANNDLNYANTMYNLRSSDLNREADLEYRKYLATLG